MKKLSSVLILFALVSAAAACGGGDDNNNNNNNNNKNRVVERYPGGGTGGGAIDGKFSIFVEDNDSGSPLSGVTVVAQHGMKALTAQTNADGRADFDDAELKGPISVHVFKQAYVYLSIFGLNASVATFGIGATTPSMPPAPQIATAKGEVTGWEAITAMGTKLAQIIPIGPDAVNVVQRKRGGMSQAANFDFNVAFNGPNIMETNYEVDFDVRTKALFVVGGLLDAMGNFNADHVGLVSPIMATAGGTIMQNVTLSAALDQGIQLDLNGPMELTTGSIGLQAQLANDLGSIGVPYDQTTDSFKTPAPTGVFAGTKLVAFGELTTDPAMGGTDRARAFTVREVSGMTATLTVQPLPGKPTAMGRNVGTTAVTGAALYELDIANSATGAPLWSANVLAGTSADFPVPPMGFTDPLTGMLSVTAVALSFGGAIDPNNAKFEELNKSNTFDSSERTTRLTF